MAEDEVAVRITGDSKALVSALNNANLGLGQFTSIFRNLNPVLVSITVAMAALGAGVKFAMDAIGKAEEARLAEIRLNAVLQNTTGYYEGLTKELKNTFEVLSKTTNFGIEEQVKAFGSLVGITHDHSLALRYWQLALDIASFSGQDLNTVSIALGRTLEGNSGILRQFGIQLKDGVTVEQALAIAQKQVNGLAEQGVSPTHQLGNAWGELAQTLGTILLPVWNKLAEGMTSYVGNLQTTMDKDIDFIKSLEDGIPIWEAFKNELFGTNTQTKNLITSTEKLTASLGDTFAALQAYYDQREKMAKYGGLPSGEELLPMPTNPPDNWKEIWPGGVVPPGYELTPEPSNKGYQYGGIVPGPVGMPVPIIAHGGEQFLGSGSRGDGGDTIIINNAGSVLTERQISHQTRVQEIKTKHRNLTSGL